MLTKDFHCRCSAYSRVGAHRINTVRVNENNLFPSYTVSTGIYKKLRELKKLFIFEAKPETDILPEGQPL